MKKTVIGESIGERMNRGEKNKGFISDEELGENES